MSVDVCWDLRCTIRRMRESVRPKPWPPTPWYLTKLCTKNQCKAHWWRCGQITVSFCLFTHYTLHSTQCTQYTLHTTHYTLHIITVHTVLHTTQYTIFYPLNTTHYTLHITQYRLYTVQYILHITHYTTP